MDNAAFDYDPFYLGEDEYNSVEIEDKLEIDLGLQPKQMQAFNSEANEILYGGAAGGGKSHFLRILSIWACTNIPGIQVYLFRRKSPDLIKNHMEGPTGYLQLLADAIRSGGAKINLSDSTIAFPNGSKIYLCHCQHEKDKYNYQGAEIHLLLIDELTHFTEDIYRYLRGRLRLGGLSVPAEHKEMFPRIVAGSNPGGVGHNWVKLTFVDNGTPLEIKRMPKNEGGMARQYIPAKLADNPALATNDPDYEDRLEGLGNPDLVRAMKNGDWNIVAGGMFDDVWNSEKHILAPFDIPESWLVDRGFDWGSSKPFSVGWFAESDGTEVTLADGKKRTFTRGSIIQIAEWYGWNGKANEGCKMLAVEVAKGIKERESFMKSVKNVKGEIQKNTMRVRPGPADSAIYATENGVCIADDMESGGIRWLKADKSPGSRVNGWEMFRKYLKSADTEEPGFYVFSNCLQTIRTIPVLQRDERKTEDVDTHAEDHIADMIRYKLSGKHEKVEQSFNRAFM